MSRGKGKPRSLTPVEEQMVYIMYKDGKPIAEIAYTNNISVSTVYRTVKRLQESEEKENVK